MGIAKDKLTASERESIARTLLSGCESHLKNGSELWGHCPFHQEETPGGAFKYDVEKDVTHCFGCSTNEDLVGLYCHCKGLATDDAEGFRSFVNEYCGGAFSPKSKTEKPAPPRVWEPKTREEATELWMKKASDFAADCNEVLLYDQEQLDRLAAWGVTAKTVSELGIGWNAKDQWRNYSGWGLPKLMNDKGKEKKIFLPKGFVFPVFDHEDFSLYRMQIRVEELSKFTPMRYREVVGGNPRLCVFGDATTRIWVVVETIRDAMYAWQDLHHLRVGAMALGGATHRPDPIAHRLLMGADLIINALDNDQAGRFNSWHFEPWNPGKFAWMNQYAHAVRGLVPSRIGKDLGDLPKAGVELKAWFWAVLPEWVRAQFRAEKVERIQTEQARKEVAA